MKNDVIGLAKKVEVDAILTTVVQQGTASKIGTFGLGAGMETGIVSTSIKLIDVTDNRTVAVISSDYPEPRTATEVIEGLLPALFNALGKTRTPAMESSSASRFEALSPAGLSSRAVFKKVELFKSS